MSGKPVAAIAVAGGDLQDQAAIQLILEMVDFGMTAGGRFHGSTILHGASHQFVRAVQTQVRQPVCQRANR